MFAEDVRSAVLICSGILQDMDTSETERNAQLGILHAERLAAHGYRQACPSQCFRIPP